MPRGRTSSHLKLRERREKAYRLYARGNSVADVRKELKVSDDTARRYKSEYEDKVREQADANPHLLRDVLDNTIRALAELEEVRKEAWKAYEATNHPNVKQGYLKTVLATQEQRAKLFGLFGVKQEYMVYVNSVKTVQDRLLAYMRDSLCDEDRRKLEEYILNELQPYMRDTLPAVIDVEPQ